MVSKPMHETGKEFGTSWKDFLLSPVLMETWSRLVKYDLVENKFLVYELEYIMMLELC
jgi:hypothetical protein